MKKKFLSLGLLLMVGVFVFSFLASKTNATTTTTSVDCTLYDIDSNGVVNDDDKELISDAFGTECDVDFNESVDFDGNGVIDALDKAAVSDHYGSIASGTYEVAYDLDEDGDVDGDDEFIVDSLFGLSCDENYNTRADLDDNGVINILDETKFLDSNCSETSQDVNSITLSGTDEDISWTVDGYSDQGFKVVWSKTSGPTYPLRSGDKYNYYTDPAKNSDTLTAFDGEGTYYVRVCEYLGGTCGVYSNEITVTLGDDSDHDQSCTDTDTANSIYTKGKVYGYDATGTYYKEYDYCASDSQVVEMKCVDGAKSSVTKDCEYGCVDGVCKRSDSDSDEVESITLSGENEYVSWEVDGYSEKGFKVVWSKTSGPTYPLRSGDRYHYYSNPDRRSDTVSAFDGEGTYYVRVCEYLGGTCGVYSNEISVNLENDDSSDNDKKVVICHVPSGNTENAKTKTVAKSALAALLKQGSYLGACVDDSSGLGKIKNKAARLRNNQLDSILAEIKELRDRVREQAAEIKYLKKLTEGVKNIAQAAQDAINNFITYGVDDNTKKLGAGERAAVMNSFKAAFKKLPETEGELEDAIKIANGRWPSLTSEEAEAKAKEWFEKIYQHIPDMDNPQENAAVTVMAYGLRQKAENRNLNSETQGIKIFKNIFGHVPQTTEEWNIMQAITYSGATRGTDTDRDLLTDEREEELGTDPNNPDTDGDGYWDGVEVANGHDPLN